MASRVDDVLAQFDLPEELRNQLRDALSEPGAGEAPTQTLAPVLAHETVVPDNNPGATFFAEDFATPAGGVSDTVAFFDEGDFAHEGTLDTLGGRPMSSFEAGASRAEPTMMALDDHEIPSGSYAPVVSPSAAPTRHATTKGGSTVSPAGSTLVSPGGFTAGPLTTDAMERYERMGIIGTGGMGEVLRVRDGDLSRTVAMKAVKQKMLRHRVMLTRFIHEAQVTAQLEHPGIVPVYELGRLDDGRHYFTMKEIKGRTFGEIIEDLHKAADRERFHATASGWTLNKAVDALRTVCEAVAYAHDRGVVHRDLKPENIMVGDYGEVLVVDWGLAKVVGRPDLDDDIEALEAVAAELVSTDKSRDDSMTTRVGAIAGTPTYMAPEQAEGEIHNIGPWTDVYALGAILYEILSGRPPYRGRDGREVLALVIAGPPPPPGRPATLPGIGTESMQLTTQGEARGGWDETDWDPSSVDGPPLPRDLLEICQHAMAREIDERYANAGQMLVEVSAWLEGAKKRAQALALVRRARKILPVIEKNRKKADRLEAEATEGLAGVKPYAPVEDKLPSWKKQEKATELRKQCELQQVKATQLLNAALTQVPDLPEAHEMLARWYLEQHREAEAGSDHLRAAQLEVMLRAHDTGLHADYLRGHGTLTLVTDPPGAKADLFQFVEKDRRLVPKPVRSLGKTPLHGIDLPMGSYMVTLRAPGRQVVRYPVFIERQGHWDGIRPGDDEPFPIYLPEKTELIKGDCYVPAGWSLVGGDPEAANSVARQWVWLDGFVMRRHPVTNKQFLAFLDDLCASGREDEAMRCAPRERAGTSGEQGALVYGYEKNKWSLRPDADGDIWEMDWPVLLVDWIAALGYGSWFGEKTGHTWRLPEDLEWEKAARGVDGRPFPWGSFPDPTFACMRDSRPTRPKPALIGEFPVDESPYRVRHMSGLVREWCGDFFRLAGPQLKNKMVDREAGTDETGRASRVIRGGAWLAPAAHCRCAQRNRAALMMRDFSLGFRLARDIGPR